MKLLDTCMFVLALALMLLVTSAASTRSPSGVRSIISASMFDEMLKHRNDWQCEAKGFYTYNAFLTAANSFGGFASSDDETIRKRELAAFFGQTSHETNGGWDSAPDGRYSWGYCLVRERARNLYCDEQQPCAPGKRYYGRGPIQLTHNYNYDKAGKAIGVDLINNPDLVATDAVISFKTAIWFWMTPQGNKPSSHDVITNRWKPSGFDRSVGRISGYGAITNIINGGIECGHGRDPNMADRIKFYMRYCDIFGLSYGDNLKCDNQKPFA